MKNEKYSIEEIKQWIEETGKSFKEATEGKEITTFFHCRNCMSEWKDNPKAYFLEAGFVGESESLIRIQCSNCGKSVFEIDLFQAQVDVLNHFILDK